MLLVSIRQPARFNTKEREREREKEGRLKVKGTQNIVVLIDEMKERHIKK
jgi:hypothetical protein